MKAWWVIILVLILGVFVGPLIIRADTLSEKQTEIEQLKLKLKDIQGQKQTLSQTVAYLNTKILLTQKEISANENQISITEAEIATLSAKISVLDNNLDYVSVILKSRIIATYKRHNYPWWQSLLEPEAVRSLFKWAKLSEILNHKDALLLEKMQTSKDQAEVQKSLKVEKQAELLKLKKQLTDSKNRLAKQQLEKQALLLATKNDEKKYQDALERAMAELEAIQAIIAGKGTETEVKSVSEGEKIAAVINGPSPCSNGAHLHFEVAKYKRHVNPSGMLKQEEVVWDNKPDEPFSFGGNWPWPVKTPARVTQGYGMTFFANVLRYYGGNPHTGIDMINQGDLNVKAVQSGTLYRGAIGCKGGALKYVHVKHSDGYDSYYLHVNY